TVIEMKEEIEKEIEEGVDDPAIFKAIFLAGGPGSGKSFTVGQTGLGALGFRIINSDEVFEFALKKAGLESTPKDIFSPKGQEIRGGAKKLTAKKMDLYLDGRLGLVIDGTGKDFNKIKKQATDLKKIGYDVGMIFVNTNLETAIARDAKRKRTLGADKVKVMWQEVQDNIGKFQNFFGGDFTVVDNSEGANWQKATLGAYKKASKFAKSPVRSPIAKKWIKDAGGRLKDMKVENLDEVTATDKAIVGLAGALIGKGIKRFGTKKGREDAAKKKSDKKKEKVDRALGAFDRKIDAIDDQIEDLEDLIKDIEKKEESFQEALNDADKQKVAAAREKILRLKDAKRKIKDQRRQKKNKLLRIKDSFSLDMQRKLAMVECVLGCENMDIQIAESITLDSKPSEIKELYKKLHGRNDKGRNQQTR
ncbi:MAG: zeta toxin family protein, partial [Bdellovibrionota bacterium]